MSEIGLKKNKNVISNYKLSIPDNFTFDKPNNYEGKSIEFKYPDKNEGIEEQHPTKKLLGTAYYMAPEIINEEQITNAVDYWALG